VYIEKYPSPAGEGRLNDLLGENMKRGKMKEKRGKRENLCKKD
jgi:hypothetical protein